VFTSTRPQQESRQVVQAHRHRRRDEHTPPGDSECRAQTSGDEGRPGVRRVPHAAKYMLDNGTMSKM